MSGTERCIVVVLSQPVRLQSVGGIQRRQTTYLPRRFTEVGEVKAYTGSSAVAGGSHTPFQGAEYAGSGVMLWTCTGIGTWTALVDGKGSVAEIGEIRPFQPISVNTWIPGLVLVGECIGPIGKVQLAPRRNRDGGCKAPIRKLQFAPPGMRRRREYVARAGPGCGIGPGELVIGEVGCGNGGHGVGCSGRRRR